jgi:Mg-chelatase subunit ChlD
MATASKALHRSFFCVDMAEFTAQDRTDEDREEARKGLYKALKRAFKKAGVSWRKCYREDRGDGLLILVHSDVPKSLLVAELPLALADALERYNATCSPDARFKLRAVVHAGEVIFDKQGVISQALNYAFRLLEAEDLKTALRNSDSVLGLIASEWIYDDVIRQHPADEPGAYEYIRGSVKETPTTGWIRLFDAARREGAPSAPQAPPARPRVPSRARALVVLVAELAVSCGVGPGEVLPRQCDVVPAQLRVLVSAEQESVIRSLADGFEEAYHAADRCRLANVRVASAPYMGGAAEAIDQGWLRADPGDVSNEADVWLPDSSLEVGQARHVLEVDHVGSIGLDSKGSFAQSPLVVAAPEKIAKDLRLTGKTVAWREVLSWPRRDIAFGRASPRTSGVGLTATVALYRAALNRDRLDAAALNRAGTPQLHGVEHAIAPGDDAIKLLCGLRESSPGSDLRRTVFLVTEKSVADYRAGARLGARCSGEPPRTAPQILPFYADEGAPVLDHPYVVIRRADVPQSPDRRRLSDAFFDYLRQPEAQERLRAAGYRDIEGRADLDESVFLGRPRTTDLAGKFDSDSLLRAWDTVRKSADVLFVVDVSRTMDTLFPYAERTRLAAAANRIDLSSRLIGGRDRIGLWEFARRLDGGRDQRELLSLGSSDKRRLATMSARLRDLRPTNRDAALYDTILAAVSHLRGSAAGRDRSDDSEDTVKAVIVIADGADTSPKPPAISELADNVVSGEPIRVFVVAFRADSCATGLDQVTQDSGGTCYEINDTAGMSRALDGIAAGLWGNPRPQ